MALYSYVVARDFGFAPNPFFGFCTLATCKPKIRAKARKGDWILGTASASSKLKGRAIYAMRVSEDLSFEKYWADRRFREKRPYMYGSKKQAFGDNIYRRHSVTKKWLQSDSHHSFPDGTPNSVNIKVDTSANRVLIAECFIYWGAAAPKIPREFRDFEGVDVCAKRGHKSRFSGEMIAQVVSWLESIPERGVIGDPIDWKKSK